MSKTIVSNIVSGFINYLENEGKSGLLPEIIKELESKNSNKKLTIIVQSACVLQPSQKKELTTELGKKYLTKDINFEIDKSLLGGFKIIIGDEVLDFSTKAKLDYFSQSI